MRAELAFQSRAVRFLLSPILAPAALIYAAALSFDRARKARRRRTLPVPVISIGNLTVGGTGKTPVVLRLAADLAALGRKPAVLTRGYAGAGVARREGLLMPGADAAGYSDEVQLMAERGAGASIAVGADRARGADALFSKNAADVFILDDGFQHWALARTLDVVCVDASRPVERFLLPLGLLREPWSALSRAGVVLLTRAELASPSALSALETLVRRHAPAASVLRARFALRLVDPAGAPVAAAAGPALALSAIGHPGAFEAALRGLGFDVSPLRFPDHHAYGPGDLSVVAARAREKNSPVIVTAKDWVKLRAAGWSRDTDRPTLWIAEQTLHFDGDGEKTWAAALARAVAA